MMKTRKTNRNHFSERLVARIKLAKNMVSNFHRLHLIKSLRKSNGFYINSFSDGRSILLWSKCKNAEIRENNVEEAIEKSNRRTKANVCSISSTPCYLCIWIPVRVSANNATKTTFPDDVASSQHGKWFG